MTKQAPRAMGQNDVSVYEYIVVGGGTAGAVVGRRLADNGHTVLILEAGPDDAGDARITFSRDWDKLLSSELDFDYELEQREGYNPLMRSHVAKVLGGCSSHNNTIALRPPVKDIDQWIAASAPSWTREVFEVAWDKVRGAIAMEQAEIRNPYNSRFLAAATQAGLERVDFDAAASESDIADAACVLPLNSIRGARQSSSLAYLQPLVELPEELTVLLETSVERIIFDTGRAVGVSTSRGEFRATREIILAAGALNTPKILMLSGVGPTQHLRDMGIAVQVDLPVGNHLLDHPEAGVLFETSAAPGGLDINGWEVAAFTEEVMIHFTPALYDDYTSKLGYPTSEHGISFTPNVRRAVSEGTVRLRSADPADSPRINGNLLSDADDADISALVAGIRLARRIADQPAMAPHLIRELAPGADAQSDESLAAYARQAGATVFHPAGTCRMGTAEDPSSVVTPDFRVKGIEGLRVADASVFPLMIGVNPCMTVFIVGEICASILLSETHPK